VNNTPFTEAEIRNYRALFPVTKNWIYLNHAGVAPISSPVLEAIHKVGQEALHHGYTVGAHWRDKVEEIRKQSAKLMGAKADEIAFVKNTSHGVSLIAQGLNLQPKDEVILSEAEFPTNLYPWMALEKKGIVLKKIPVRRGELKLEALEKLVTRKTKVISLSSVQYGNGFKLPVEEIGQFCTKHKIYFLLDAIQSLGAFPIDVAKAHVDFLSADAHKWLLGPEGIGILYVRKNLIQNIEPVLLGWHSVVKPFYFDQIHFSLHHNAKRFEEGSPNTFSIYGLGAAIDLLLEVGVERIARHILSLTDTLIDGLQKLGLVLANSLNPKFRSGIVAFRFPEDPQEKRLNALERHLFSKEIFVTVRRRNLRVSPHFYNTEQEIEILLKEVKNFLKIAQTRVN
jgi:cysteine desulfurase/selenocysteine lyase